MKIRIFLLFLLLACCSPCWAETIRVNPSKTARLPEILASLKTGDTVIFERGIYRTAGALEISGLHDVTLQGEGKVEIVLADLDDAVISVSSCQRVRIRGLRARHAQPNEEYACEGAVIRVENSEQVAVSDCWLNGCGAAGVYATGVKDLVIANNTIFNNTFAAVWVYQSSGLVYGNRMHDNAAELITLGESDITMAGNSIEDNQGNSYGETDWARSVLDGR